MNQQSEVANTLTQQLDDFIKNESLLDDALIGISIRSASTGEKLYDHIGNIRLHPASNMKLLTAAASLSILGEDYTFGTELLTDGAIKENKLRGNLYLRGRGDPTLLPTGFDTLAEEVQKNGVTMIEGNIIGDDTWYDNVRLSADLNWSDEHFYYGAQVSALTASPNTDYDAGSVIVEVTPGNTNGEEPIIKLSPDTKYVNISNKAKTVSNNVEEDITITRIHGTNHITIEGTIPAQSSAVKEWISVWEPTGYALDLFQQSLKKNGISWSGNVKQGVVPNKADLLVSHQSMPLSELLVPFMKLSNNGHAETLVKEMGKIVHGEGSWEKGLEVVKMELAKFGMNTETLLLRDGSGISHINLIPANEVSNLLYTVQEEEWFPAFLHSLPIAGHNDRMIGGTLRERMRELPGKVKAKTGTIYGVSTLSGYVETSQGENLIFSIMLNNLLDEEVGAEIIDKIVNLIAV
ncbi:D-alanyl-D-alanine carboxypeptidase/D-alanyl-D-alanine endopeptidase [Virgibacillus ndiopensis]|uniref:D-alanyl-D-alanine carboxypeptidase/D-alanyl-D-alanine endopeptidase n=1 Tax=Virgibacillus ndiopensis TaxID=2004408 RepID=UPI000C08D7AE|nr:D-alanyl-D-alanine carboxypeptidase/D-alanyl-D-alanine-endopeptidase [Virgibacillus ndiopensis]